MKISIEDIGPSLSEAEISGFERELGASLPDDYRAFLLRNNGGTPVRCAYEDEGVEAILFEFLSLVPSREDGLRCYWDEVKYEVGDGLLPFAINHAAEVLCLSLPGGEVYCTDGFSTGEGNQGLRHIADSFGAFFSLLFEQPERGDLFTRIAEQGNASDVFELTEGDWNPREKSIHRFTLLEEASKCGNVCVVRA